MGNGNAAGVEFDQCSSVERETGTIIAPQANKGFCTYPLANGTDKIDRTQRSRRRLRSFRRKTFETRRTGRIGRGAAGEQYCNRKPGQQAAAGVCASGSMTRAPLAAVIAEKRRRSKEKPPILAAHGPGRR